MCKGTDIITVVQYLISSPNHNSILKGKEQGKLFSILFHHQTTTYRLLPLPTQELFSILFHHQTTTQSVTCSKKKVLFSILFHHQTTTSTAFRSSMRGCLVSYFITKPQLGISTMTCPLRCLVSYFITKPQLPISPRTGLFVVQYLISSPNHNCFKVGYFIIALFSILFHHQTTTLSVAVCLGSCCLVSYFITKPQPTTQSPLTRFCCLVSYFITKPQPEVFNYNVKTVVQYLISSPNHNHLK